jgi:hypothetical protein
MTCHSLQMFLEKEVRRNIIWLYPDSRHCGGWKIKARYFFGQKTIFQLFFDPQHLENIIDTLINPSMALKKPEKYLKIWNQPKAKNLLELKFVVLSAFKVKTNT